MSQNITLTGWAIQIEELPDGGKAIVYQEVHPPSGNVIVFPLDESGAKEIGGKLAGSKIQVAPASALRVISGGGKG